MLDEKKSIERYVNFLNGFHKNHIPSYNAKPLSYYDRFASITSFDWYTGKSVNEDREWEIVSKFVTNDGKEVKFTVRLEGQNENYPTTDVRIPVRFLEDPDGWELDYMIEKLSEVVSQKKNTIRFQEEEIKRYKRYVEKNSEELRDKVKLLEYLKKKKDGKNVQKNEW